MTSFFFKLLNCKVLDINTIKSSIFNELSKQGVEKFFLWRFEEGSDFKAIILESKEDQIAVHIWFKTREITLTVKNHSRSFDSISLFKAILKASKAEDFTYNIIDPR